MDHVTRSVRIAIAAGALALLAVIGLGAWQWHWDLSALESWLEDHAVVGAGAYVALVAASIVLLPLSSLPLIPVASMVYSVWAAALLSAAGWWIGALLAFQLARWGRPYLERVTSLEAVDRLERNIPDDVGFAGIVMLRMIFPVDVMSFALGLLKGLGFSMYAIASLIGILPFAFVWSFAGGELGRGRFLSFAVVSVGMLLAVLSIRRLWKHFHARSS